MDPKLKKTLRGISLEIRRLLEGYYDDHGNWQAGDLERRLNELGVWRNRNAKPVEELQLSPEDKAARRLVDGYLKLREEAGVEREKAVSEFVRESAYTWANRLFALRCMEARDIIDEVILQKDAYGGRSLVHNRYAKKNPHACAGADDGLFAVLFEEFTQRAKELPVLFDPKSPAVALRPSIAALKRTIALLSGRERARGQDAATDEVFAAPDAFGWAYQYCQDDEKERVDNWLKSKEDFKCEGADIIPKTALYTESYMVKFLVQNSLGALWMGMYPDSKVCEQWEYYVKDADRAPVTRKPVREITFLDPAQGSGHFHLEAFDLFYAMYAEEAAREGRTLTPREICAAILNENLFGIDIDGRSVQIATAALWMKAKERAPDMEAGDLTSFREHVVATNIRLPKGKDHLELFLHKHPEDALLRPALELVFQGLEHADELGSLLKIEELVEAALRRLKAEADKSRGTAMQPGLFASTLIQGTLPVPVEDFDKWKRDALNRLQAHFEAEAQAVDPVQAFFGVSAGKGLTFVNLLARRYDVVAANPPYLGAGSMGKTLKKYTQDNYTAGKRDLYAAFIMRCADLAGPGGRVSMVTRQSWMFLRYFKNLRAEKDEDGAFNSGVLCETSVELVAQLGPGAFEEISGEVVTVVMFVLNNRAPLASHTMIGARMLSYPDPPSKAAALRSWAANAVSIPTYKSKQLRLLSLIESPMIFWLTEGFWNLFDNSEKLQDHADVVEGVQTGNNLRWLRFFWEIPEDYKHREREWACYLKGGGYRRWAGLDETMVRWSESGDLLAQFPGATLRNRERYFGLGLSYTDFANGCLGVRLLRGDEVFDLGAPAVFSKPISPWTLEKLACILNCRICSVLIRFLSPNPQHIRTGYLRLIPLPLRLPDPNADAVVRWCVKQCIEIESQFNLLSRHFLPNSLGSVSAMLTHSLKLAFGDTFLEKAAFECFGLQESDTEVVVNQTGRPLFMLPLLDGYSSVPGDLLDREANTLLAATVGNLTTVSLDETGLRQKRSAIRSAFESGSTFMGAPEGDSGHSADEEEGEDEQFEETVIPPQTAIEALAIQLSLHPMSIYLLLQEGIGREGWRCLAEERRLHEDHFTVKVLRVLGHRWPEQIEAGESVPVWSDQDGVVPLTGGGETTLLERVRKRLVEDFPGGNVAALEREFEEIVGVPLEQWLSGPFFQRHISHFKKRPIAWQIETDARGQRLEGRKKKRGEVARPVFACLIYYHKLDEDLLPKIRTQYVGVLRSGFETELRTLEHLGNATPAQQGRKLQLDQWIEEMKAFDVKLEQVSLTGFGPPAIRPALRQYAINDALLSLTATWLGRLNETVASGPLKKWLDAAAATKLHPDFPRWMEGSLSHLDYFCAVLGPTPPKEDTFPADPTSPDLAPLVCHDAKGMVKESIKLACARWWKLLDETVLEPLRQEVKAATEEIKKLDVELKTAGLAFQRRNELGERKHELKQKVKTLRKEHDEKSSLAKRVREEIEDWTCPKAETWKLWLSEQPLFDKVASLDGKREPPQTLAEFIAQESAYAPDINDGVRVNIAPLQKAGLLHTDVLDSKDADKAIADRAEWRSDERRWVREGKLPQPGWWESKKSTT